MKQRLVDAGDAEDGAQTMTQAAAWTVVNYRRGQLDHSV